MLRLEIKNAPELIWTPGNRPPGISLPVVFKTEYTDNYNIPLSSDRGNPKRVREIDWKYQPNPFKESPSRYPDGHPHSILMSGLERERLAANYPAIISIMNDVRRMYLAREGSTPDQTLSFSQIGELLRGLFFLPHYLVYRAKNPIPHEGVLPSPIILLSNSSSGTLGAFEAHAQYFGTNNLEPEKIREAAEKTGAMVGHQTVCVASPEQMDHFFNLVMNGTDQRERKFDIHTLLSDEEFPNLLQFGHHAYEAYHAIGMLKGPDTQFATEIDRHIRRRHNPRDIKAVISRFQDTARIFLNAANLHQQQANLALGREINGPQITVDGLGEDFKMVTLMRQYNPRTTPRRR